MSTNKQNMSKELRAVRDHALDGVKVHMPTNGYYDALRLAVMFRSRGSHISGTAAMMPYPLFLYPIRPRRNRNVTGSNLRMHSSVQTRLRQATDCYLHEDQAGSKTIRSYAHSTPQWKANLRIPQQTPLTKLHDWGA
jgi:hypothetical protein